MSAPDRETLRELVAAYALGALDADEAQAFERELARSPELRREVAQYREVAALVARGAPRAAPSDALRRRLLERLVREKRVRPRWTEGLAWAAAIAGLLVGAVTFVRSRALQDELALVRSRLDTARTTLAQREEMLRTILGPGTVSFALSSSAAREPTIQVFWSRPTNRWVLSASNLPPAPAGRAYQLWFLQDGRAVPSITFNPDSAGSAVVTAPGPETTAGLTGAAITEEPASGSPQPTSTPILVGQLSR